MARGGRIFPGRALCLSAAMALLSPVSAWGQAVTPPAILHHFDIQDASLAQALTAFSEQSQTQILFESRLADGLQVHGGVSRDASRIGVRTATRMPHYVCALRACVKASAPTWTSHSSTSCCSSA